MMMMIAINAAQPLRLNGYAKFDRLPDVWWINVASISLDVARWQEVIANHFKHDLLSISMILVFAIICYPSIVDTLLFALTTVFVTRTTKRMNKKNYTRLYDARLFRLSAFHLMEWRSKITEALLFRSIRTEQTRWFGFDFPPEKPHPPTICVKLFFRYIFTGARSAVRIQRRFVSWLMNSKAQKLRQMHSDSHVATNSVIFLVFTRI